MLLRAFFSTDAVLAKGKYNVSAKMSILEQRYSSMKLLHGVQSLPKLKKWSSWKADQIRCFFLYLIVPLFHGVLRSEYYSTLCKFNKALIMMFKPTITESEIEELEELLQYVFFIYPNKPKKLILCAQ